MRLSAVIAAVRMLVLLALGVIFALSGVVKLLDPQLFQTVLEDHGVIPHRWIRLVSVGVIAAELLLGAACIGVVLLLMTKERATAQAWARRLLWWCCGAFGTFFVYALALVVLGPDEPVDCGCGIFGKMVVDAWWIALRNGMSFGLVAGIAWVGSVRATDANRP